GDAITPVGKSLLAFTHRRPVTAHRQAPCDRIPNPSLLILLAPKQFVAPNLDFPRIAPYPRSLNRHLLTIDHHRTILVPTTPPFLLPDPLVPRPGDRADFVLHDQQQQLPLRLQ